MIRHILFILLTSLICVNSALSAFGHPAISPSTAACAETLADSRFSAGMLSLTPASLKLLHRIGVEFSSQRLYSMSELACYDASVAVKRGRLALGASYESVGTSDLYRESVVAAHVGFALSAGVFAGASGTYNLAEMGGGYGSANCLSASAGVIVSPSDRLFLYANLANPTEPELVAGTRLNREIRIGVVAGATEKATLAVEIFSRRGNDTRFRVGEVYEISQYCRLAAGVMTAPFVPSFGFRLSWHDVDILYAYRYHGELGSTHIWGVSLSH